MLILTHLVGFLSAHYGRLPTVWSKPSGLHDNKPCAVRERISPFGVPMSLTGYKRLGPFRLMGFHANYTVIY